MNTDILLHPCSLGGKIPLHPSKSYLHRLIITSYLACGNSKTLHLFDEFKDIQDLNSTIDGMNALLSSDNKQVFTGESASTLRMLLPLALTMNKPCKFILAESLAKRPIKFLLDILTDAGATCTTSLDENNRLNIDISGKINPGTYTLDTAISSQHISGFLFALPLLDKPCKLIVNKRYSEKSYINITLNVIKQFGIRYDIEKFQDRYVINVDGRQTYTAPTRDILSIAEPDFSNLAPWLIARAIGSDTLTLADLPSSSPQPDSIIMKIINTYDTMNREKIRLNSSEEEPYTIDISKSLDLFPPLCVLAAFSNTKTLFTNIDKLKIKESDRVKSMQDILAKINIDTSISKNTLLINGNPESVSCRSPKGIIHLNSYGDHRIAMAAIILSCRLNTPIHLCGADALKKSYPSFLEEFKSLGGKYDIYV